MKIYIFGTGRGCDRLIPYLRKETEIMAFVDNAKEKQGNQLFGHPIESVNQIKDGYDYIVVSVKNSGEIIRQLGERGIIREKILCFYEIDDISRPETDEVMMASAWGMQLQQQKIKNLSHQIDTLSNLVEELNNQVDSLLVGGNGVFSSEDIMVGKAKIATASFLINGDTTLSEEIREDMR